MPDWILPLLTIVFGGGGLITAIVAWRKDARQGPVEHQTAQVADAMVLSNAASELIKTLTDRQKNFEDRIGVKEVVWEGKLEAQDTKIDHLQSRVDSWIFWYNDLKVNWFLHRVKDVPPVPPDTSAPI
jgi:hypothetical protein